MDKSELFIEKYSRLNKCGEELRTVFYIYYFKYYLFRLIKSKKYYVKEYHFDYSGSYSETVSFASVEDAEKYIRETLIVKESRITIDKFKC